MAQERWPRRSSGETRSWLRSGRSWIGSKKVPLRSSFPARRGSARRVLWQAGAKEAEHRFGRVLSHRSAEAEALLSFTGLSDLLAPVFDDVAPLLAPLRRRALEVALLLAEPGETAPDSGAIGLAVLDILRALTDRGPVLVALDDIQWLDLRPRPRAPDRPSSPGQANRSAWWRRSVSAGRAAPARARTGVSEGTIDPPLLGPLSLGSLHRLLGSEWESS